MAKTSARKSVKKVAQARDFEPTKVALLVAVVAVVSLTVFALFANS